MEPDKYFLTVWLGAFIVLLIGACYLYNKLGKIPPSE